MRKPVLLKFISGKLNSPEKEAVIKWIRNSPENQKTYNLLKAAYVAKQLKKTSNETSLDEVEEFLIPKKKRTNRAAYISIAASFVLIPILFWALIHLNSDLLNTNNENELRGDHIINLITAKGKKEKVVLPDGSIVTLNVDSKISYPNNFDGNIREVKLIGEAFFDVKRNESKPFIVYANEIKIKVLGTSFNIKSYPQDKNVETTLVSGMVEVLKKKEKTPVVLIPSQRAIYNKSSNKLKVDVVKSEDITAWRNGGLVFDNTPMSQIAKDLERKYDIEFEINSKELLTYEYTGTFKDLTLKEVLEFLKISSPITYQIKDHKIILNMN